MRAKMMHRLLAFAVQYVQLTASDIQVTYSQQDEPGPAPAAGCHLEGKDRLQLSVRQIALIPLGVWQYLAFPILMCLHSAWLFLN